MRGALVLIVVAILGIALVVSFSEDRSRNGSARQEPAYDPGATHRGAPGSMAAIGDSITQAVNLGYGSGDAARLHSWATGRDPDDPVVSHLERLSQAESSIDVAAYNNAVSGARMEDAPRQARLAVSQSADYVVVLMGANDACASNRFSMTPVRSFRRHFRGAIETLVTGLPNALIYVVSIPDVSRLWDVMHDDPQARESWRAFGTCRVLLGDHNSERDRLRVRGRVEEFNDVLGDICGRHQRCHYDGGAVFRYRFAAEDVSTVDFFHPSITGQSHLAEVSWRHGPFADPAGGAP